MSTVVLDAATVTRTEVVRPAMCGHNSLFVGRIGDWTWDAVTHLCDVDVLRAKAPSGAPTYLSFYYYRIRGARRFHLRTPTFGDRLLVSTSLFGFGSESVLALHRIRPDDGAALPELDPDAFYAEPDGDLRVETFNRWVTRSQERTNTGLVRSSPLGFRHEHLPLLPERYSPRLLCQQARARQSFVEDGPDLAEIGPVQTFRYAVDPSRDLNGVGLLYFASYFSIVDWALLQRWRADGRDVGSFLDRVVVDQQLCLLGNADADAVVVTQVRHRRSTAMAREVFDVILHEGGTGRLLGLCTIQIETGERS